MEVRSLSNNKLFMSMANLTRAISSGLLAWSMGSSFLLGEPSPLDCLGLWLRGDWPADGWYEEAPPKALKLSCFYRTASGTLSWESWWTGVTLLHRARAVSRSLHIWCYSRLFELGLALPRS